MVLISVCNLHFDNQVRKAEAIPNSINMRIQLLYKQRILTYIFVFTNVSQWIGITLQGFQMPTKFISYCVAHNVFTSNLLRIEQLCTDKATITTYGHIRQTHTKHFIYIYWNSFCLKSVYDSGMTYIRIYIYMSIY